MKTLYFGGGTPTMLSDSAIASIVLACTRHLNYPDEMTLEANPEHVSPERAKTWKNLGFTRVSLGVQSFDDEMLQLLGRHHHARQIFEAVESLYAAGIDEISIDLIYGGCTHEHCCRDLEIKRWRKDLEAAAQLRASHVSCYELTLEENTPLCTMYHRGQNVLCDEDTIVDMMEMIPDTLGMRQYEISNYSREGYFSAHNVSCWGGLPYLGLGPGAHSFHPNGATFHRRANAANIRAWMKSFAEGISPEPEFEEDLSPLSHFGECLMCAARTRFWWSPQGIAASLGLSSDCIQTSLAKAVSLGLLEQNDDLFRTTTKGVQLNNRLDSLLIDSLDD